MRGSELNREERFNMIRRKLEQGMKEEIKALIEKDYSMISGEKTGLLQTTLYATSHNSFKIIHLPETPRWLHQTPPCPVSFVCLPENGSPISYISKG